MGRSLKARLFASTCICSIGAWLAQEPQITVEDGLDLIVTGLR